MTGRINVTVNNVNYSLNPSRYKRMLNADSKAQAVYMGLLDRFQDIFRTDKKAHALSVLYDFMYPSECTDNEATHEREGKAQCDFGTVLTAYHNLVDCAEEAYKHLLP